MSATTAAPARARVSGRARGLGRWRRRRATAAAATATATRVDGRVDDALDWAHTTVMKFGGSSLADAKRVREVGTIVRSFPEETPVVVLSAMGRTTNDLLRAGELALRCDGDHE